jgi:hypothetical protein
MRAILTRVARLEDRYAIHPSGELKVAVRLIISFPWKGRLNLAASTCKRALNTVGAVIEIVRLEGRCEDIDEEGLEKFIASFPVTRGGG